MILARTQIPGFMKDKKSNTLINTNQEKIQQIREKRLQYKAQKNLENRVQALEEEMASLRYLVESRR